jgi:putative endonuclease
MKFQHIAVYIISDQRRGKLYIGVTGNLHQRIWEHKEKLFEGYSSRYGLGKLVYYETWMNMSEAIKRETQLKAWNRWKKINLIEDNNPQWEDLYRTLNIS